MSGAKNWFRNLFYKPQPEKLTALTLDYSALEAIGKRIGRTLEVQLTDGTIIRIFDRNTAERKKLEFY